MQMLFICNSVGVIACSASTLCAQPASLVSCGLVVQVGTQTVVTGHGIAQNGGAVFIPSTAVVGGVAQQNVVTTSQPVRTLIAALPCLRHYGSNVLSAQARCIATF